MDSSLRPLGGDVAVLLPRPNLVAAVLSTPPGGTCVLEAVSGSGRRTLLRQALGPSATYLRVGGRRPDDATWRRDLGEALGVGAPPVPADPVRQLASSPHRWLVLEDVAPSAPEPVLADVARLVDSCPPTHRIALTTAHDLRGVVAGRARDGRLLQIGDADLALPSLQARELLAILDPLMDEEEAAAVVELADGWLAALLAAARRRTVDPHGSSAAWLAGRGAETLWGPWWDGLPDDARTVLLDTAFVPVLEPGLVDALARSVPDAAAWLPRLARDPGPLRPVRSDHGSISYRRHPLLTSLALTNAAGRSDEADLRRAAADWYGAHGDLGLQMQNLVAAGDRADALAIIDLHIDDLMVEGHAETVRGWFDAIGLEGYRDSAGLYLRTGWAACLTRDRTAAHVALSRLVVLTSMPGPDEDEQRVLRGEAAALDAYLAQIEGDVQRSGSSAATATECFGTAWSTNSQQFAPLLRIRSLLVTGDVVGAAELLGSIEGRPFTTSAFSESQHPSLQADLAWITGRVHASRAWAARQRRWLALQQPEGWLQSVHGSGTAYWLVAAEDGRTPEAISGLVTAAEHAAAADNVTDRVTVMLALATVHLAAGDGRSALEACLLARSLVLRESPHGGLLAPVLVVEARIRARAGDVLRAERLLAQVPRSTERDLLAARIALQRGTVAATRTLAEIRVSTPRERAEQALLMAWSQLQTSPRRAEQLLLACADIAAEHGMTTLLVGAPEPVLAMARRAAGHFVHDTLASLVRRAEQIPPAHGSPAPPPVSLSRGELQLLTLLPTRKSNAALAAELHVSVNTIKTRLRRLYVKVDVHDRDEAVAWAHRVGLVGDATGPG